MTNRHVIIGWLGGSSEIFIHYDFKEGGHVAKELKRSPAWIPIYSGSLIDLISFIKKATSVEEALRGFLAWVAILQVSSDLKIDIDFIINSYITHLKKEGED